MIKIFFRNMEKSDLVKKILLNRLNETVNRFPDLARHRIYLTLTMDNSSSQPGPDLFGVKLQISGRKFGNLILEKKASSLYLAIVDIAEALLERLNRRIDKARVIARTQARRVHELQEHGVEREEQFADMK